jgi:peroxiredoxin
MEKLESTPSWKVAVGHLNDNLGTMLPPEALNIFDSYANELARTLATAPKIHAGDKAPDFTLTNHLGANITLDELLKTRKVVLLFYRGAWCPYCNLQFSQFQGVTDEIKKLGAELVAISPQTPDASLSMAEKHQLSFQVLSDVGNIVAKTYTVVFRHDKKATDTLKSLGIDFDSHYGDDSHELPVPAVFVIQKNGIVTFAKSAGADWRNRVDVSEVLTALGK